MGFIWCPDVWRVVVPDVTLAVTHGLNVCATDEKRANSGLIFTRRDGRVGGTPFALSSE
jgi:hypothetical protein